MGLVAGGIGDVVGWDNGDPPFLDDYEVLTSVPNLPGSKPLQIGDTIFLCVVAGALWGTVPGEEGDFPTAIQLCNEAPELVVGSELGGFDDWSVLWRFSAEGPSIEKGVVTVYTHEIADSAELDEGFSYTFPIKNQAVLDPNAPPDPGYFTSIAAGWFALRGYNSVLFDGYSLSSGGPPSPTVSSGYIPETYSINPSPPPDFLLDPAPDDPVGPGLPMWMCVSYNDYDSTPIHPEFSIDVTHDYPVIEQIIRIGQNVSTGFTRDCSFGLWLPRGVVNGPGRAVLGSYAWGPTAATRVGSQDFEASDDFYRSTYAVLLDVDGLIPATGTGFEFGTFTA